MPTYRATDQPTVSQEGPGFSSAHSRRALLLGLTIAAVLVSLFALSLWLQTIVASRSVQAAETVSNAITAQGAILRDQIGRYDLPDQPSPAPEQRPRGAARPAAISAPAAPDPPPTPAAKPQMVAWRWQARPEYAGDGVVEYWGEVRNAGTARALVVQVNAGFYDAAGRLLVVHHTYCDPLDIPPGATHYFRGLAPYRPGVVRGRAYLDWN